MHTDRRVWTHYYSTAAFASDNKINQNAPHLSSSIAICNCFIVLSPSAHPTTWSYICSTPFRHLSHLFSGFNLPLNAITAGYRINIGKASHIFQIRNVRTVPNIFSLHVMQSSMLFAHSSQATKCRHGRNNVCTRVRLHFRQVISERNRSFSFFSLSLSKIDTRQQQTCKNFCQVTLAIMLWKNSTQQNCAQNAMHVTV